MKQDIGSINENPVNFNQVWKERGSHAPWSSGEKEKIQVHMSPWIANEIGISSKKIFFFPSSV